ncbi:hypothetical protein PY479_06100 [Shewanella sp. A32]|uniref:hypothetical protein n=1 Tax=Shewanella sp. A32 TaxID=3031327 RepID=UPI0023B88C3C|nr:hypothetical protein [Shewanella sp. A32]MDF0533847.1 hypothetical protein [Shewanella sp. A32]
MAITSLSRFAAITLIAAGTLLPLHSQAENLPEKMEVITVTYVGSVNYALYQQFAETMGEFHFELLADIHDTAKNSSRQMASEFFDTYQPLVADNQQPVETTAYNNTHVWGSK